MPDGMIRPTAGSARIPELEIRFTGDVPIARVRRAVGAERLAVTGHRLTCSLRGDFDSLLEAIGDAGVASPTSHEPSLEETFLDFFEHA